MPLSNGAEAAGLENIPGRIYSSRLYTDGADVARETAGDLRMKISSCSQRLCRVHVVCKFGDTWATVEDCVWATVWIHPTHEDSWAKAETRRRWSGYGALGTGVGMFSSFQW